MSRGGCSPLMLEGLKCLSLYPCLIRSRRPSGEVVVRLGVPLVDDYLEFLEGRCRPNTVLAAAYDLRVFFGVVGKEPHEVVPADVLGFITAQRTGRVERGWSSRWWRDGEPAGVATSTVARRLSSVSGFFGYLQARGDVVANPVPRGLPTRRERSTTGSGCAVDAPGPAAAEDPDPGRGRRADRCAAHPPGPGDGRGDGARWAASLRGPRAADGRRAGGRAAAVHRRRQGRAPAARAGVLTVLHGAGQLPGGGTTRAPPAPTGCSSSSRARTVGIL